MALSPRSGFQNTESQPSSQTPVTQADKFDQVPTVRSVNTQRTAYNSEDYPRQQIMAMAYVEGSPLKTTLYHVMTTGTSNRSALTDATALRDNIDIPLMKISNFEMKIQQGVTFTWDGEQAESTVTGEAVTYPGFNPNIGDVFIMELASGQTGLFTINNVEPLSHFNERLHRISFHMERALNSELHQLLEDRVKRAVVFDLTMYLSGNKTLLTEDSYTLNQALLNLRKILIRYYFQEHYSQQADTFLHPEGYYDPYVVRFMTAIVSFTETRKRPRQLYTQVMDTYGWSIWARLTENYNLGMRDICGVYDVTVQTNAYTDVSITSLVNRGMVKLKPELRSVAIEEWPVTAQGNYALSAAFYDADVDNMTPFEVILYNVVTTRTVADIPGFISTYLDTYLDLSKEEQFYYIPLYLRILDIARSSLAPNIR